VVATYGRGAWILEDISPLEQLEPATLAAKAFLFTLRPAYRFRPQQGVASAPNSAVEPDTVPYGADVTYYVSPSVADTSTPPDTWPAPSRTRDPSVTFQRRGLAPAVAFRGKCPAPG
jgi:hypothetical protein